MKLARFFLAGLAALAAGREISSASTEIEVAAHLRPSGRYPALLAVNFRLPEDYRLYADTLKLETDPAVALVLLMQPEPESIQDDAGDGELKNFFTGNFSLVYALTNAPPPVMRVRVGYQACDATICFLPQTRDFTLAWSNGIVSSALGNATAQTATTEKAGTILDRLSTRFEERARRVGYLDARGFLEFLEEGTTQNTSKKTNKGSRNEKGFWWLALVVFFGGLALNLTPCVLPMIPVNVAIIGAGVMKDKDSAVLDKQIRAQRRRRGFVRGLVYGAGMCLAYGLAGAIVVRTGAVFGAFNAHPWFNFGVAVLFACLALAMFDVFTVDFSRWQGRIKVPGGSLAAVFGLGALAALLGGACVAPVVIAVLAQAALFYTEGRVWLGLALPFLLGAGMALPWPIIGAGLAILPKPGRWMNTVKRALGALILVLAGYYAYQGWLLAGNSPRQQADMPPAHAAQENWLVDFDTALETAWRSGKPLLIDFWATWCKSCALMDATTLKNQEVIARLENFVLLKYQADEPSRPPAREILAALRVMGLPTYIILQPAARRNLPDLP